MGKPNEKDLREQWIEDVRWVMSGPRGRRFVREIISRAGLFESGFRHPSPMVRPEERLVFNAAWRDFGQWVHDEAARCAPTTYDTMNLEKRLTAQMERDPQPEKKEEED